MNLGHTIQSIADHFPWCPSGVLEQGGGRKLPAQTLTAQGGLGL